MVEVNPNLKRAATELRIVRLAVVRELALSN
jgi:hypothetical protein